MKEDLLRITADVNGKPIPFWQQRLEQMYTDGVPFGEMLSLVRALIDDCVIDRILNKPDEEVLALPGNHEEFAADMRQKFDTIARLVSERDALLAACEVAEHALRSYQYGNSATDLAREIADQVAAAIAKARQEPAP